LGKIGFLLIAMLAVGALTLALEARSSAPTLAAAAGDAQSVYLANCSGCHGASGQGAVNIAPPLAKNPYVTGNPAMVIRTMLGGMAGPVKEHGTTWNGSMPPWQGTLSNAQLADVITYIRSAWGNKAAPVTAQAVAALVVSAQPTAAPVSSALALTKAQAAAIYVANCSGCHGAAGQGAINIAPALAANPSVTGNPKMVIHVVLDGSAGPITERGITWTGSLPPWNGTLSDAQLAAVISYIRSSWGNKAGPVSERQVGASK
jgi:mono/diheme cytochrome c family protein